jgi:glycosyltransferase involved in cell wall biosynthesis
MNFTFGIITDGNNEGFIKKTIESIKKQQIPNFEIIIIGGKKEYEGKMARGTSISSNVWTMYHNTINNGLRPRSSLGFGKAEIRF